MDALDKRKITSIGKVNTEVTLFLRELGVSDYMIMKIYEAVGDASIAIIEEDPFWILEEFPHLGFKKVDLIASKLGFSPVEARRVEAALKYVLGKYLSEGHSFAPRKELVYDCATFLDIRRETVEDYLEDLIFSGDIHISKLDGRELVYFYEYYRAECRTCSRLKSIEGSPEKLKNIAPNLVALIKKYEADAEMALTSEQREAVISALANGVSIITGGPGTGKTTIINAIIYVLEQSGCKVAVCAPTGRAAKRIMETGGHFAQTVHRLLEYYYDDALSRMMFGRNSEDSIDYDCIIVDEASMIDIMLMEALTDAIKDGTRLILVGDRNQLPSVGAGNVFADLINSEYFFTVELKQIHRQASESLIVHNAHLINEGETNLRISDNAEGDFFVYREEKQDRICTEICEKAARYQQDDIQVLTPTKKGKLGTAELNIKLQEIFNPPAEDKPEMKFGNKIIRVGDRVMQIKNNYKLSYRRKRHDVWGGDGTEAGYMREDGRGIFNGEIGKVVGINPEMKSLTVAYDDDISDRREERFVEYEYTKLDELEHAYAVTVHKSQGSEYPVVIIPVSWFPDKLATRSLIYTAVTRGRDKVIIVGDMKYVCAMINNDNSSYRMSALADRIKLLYSE